MEIEKLLNEEPVQLNKLATLLKNNAPILIFGSGNLGKKIGEFLIENKSNVIAFADNNNSKWNTSLLKIKILDPNSIDKETINKAIIIVAIWSPGNAYNKTQEQLKQLGARNIFNAATLMQLFPNELLPHYHFAEPQFYIDHKKELSEVYDFLADDESKRQFLAQLKYRFQVDFDSIPTPDTENQYFLTDIVNLSDDEVFLDCGAYDGDTLEQFSKRTKNKFKKYIALEPDPENYTKLQQRITLYPENLIDIFPYAVGDSNCTLKFNATGGEGAGLSNAGSISVECKTIDDYFYQYKPTFIKFDIEGAEQSALKGARKTITDYRPLIAVCLYHLPDDMWTIPILLKSYNNKYKFYVRTHAIDGFEFVLYAIPE
jgi:FkbM family methyltransferase